MLVPMVVWPQDVPFFGATEYGDIGYAHCTGCGGRHLILGGHKGLIW